MFIHLNIHILDMWNGIVNVLLFRCSNKLYTFLKLKRILDWKIRNYTLVCLSKINNSIITIRLVIVQNIEVWLNADEVAENDSELFSCVRLCIFHSCFAFIANQLEMCLEIGLFTTPIAWKTWNFKSFYDDELFKEIPVISILTFVLSKICFN